jgi:hypothetical protein
MFLAAVMLDQVHLAVPIALSVAIGLEWPQGDNFPYVFPRITGKLRGGDRLADDCLLRQQVQN